MNPKSGSVRPRSIPQSAAVKNWVFTVNNWTDDDITLIDRFVQDGLLRYVCYGKEICPSTKTPHLQGFLQLFVRRRFDTLKKQLPDKWHIARATGTPGEAITYCKKEGDFTESGELQKSGARNDLGRVAKQLDDGATLDEIRRSEPESYIRYSGGIKAYKTQVDLQKKREGKPKVRLFTGPSGSGKSYAAVKQMEHFHPGDWWQWTGGDGKWFDAYDGQTGVIFDEFRGQMPFSLLLKLLDYGTPTVDTKGGKKKFLATDIIIATKVPPEEWYEKLTDSDTMDQLQRRIDMEYEFDVGGRVFQHITGIELPTLKKKKKFTVKNL